jgi:hypothetical protein
MTLGSPASQSRSSSHKRAAATVDRPAPADITPPERATTASSAKNPAVATLITRPRSRETTMAETSLIPIAAAAKAATTQGHAR